MVFMATTWQYMPLNFIWANVVLNSKLFANTCFSNIANTCFSNEVLNLWKCKLITNRLFIPNFSLRYTRSKMLIQATFLKA